MSESFPSHDPSTIITKTIYIQNQTLNKEELQRYANELKYCQMTIKLMNDSDIFYETRRNWTNAQTKYEQCNNKMEIIKETIK